ncbi:sugar ABC transporter permease [bacterium]|nr:sugar ABC transporter permease [bacterium]MBU4361662.1 sugar ABC transporter permease [bacterium]
MKLKKYLSKKVNRNEFYTALICLFPSLVIGMTFVIIPIIMVIYLSFTKWDLISETKDFIGLANYIYLFKNPKFLKSISNTFYFAAVQIPLDLVFSLFFAFLLDKKIRGLRFFRAIYFAPVVTSMVAVSAIWLWFYDPQFGLFNYILKQIGFSPLKWLYDPNWAMPAIVIMSVWKGLGYNIVIFLAGLQNIPESYYEAADIDGANNWEKFKHITLPLLSPVTYFVILISIINSFKVFTQISVMTPRGGPLYSTGVMVFYIYQQGFEGYKIGRASAAAMILFLGVLAITFVQKRIGEKRVHYT